MGQTSIEWTERTWKPVTGCTKVSQGCKNCYAEGIADRFFAKQYPPNADGTPRKFTDVRCHEDRLDQPLHWRKPCRVFVNSMSDLFHESVPFDFIDAIFATMAACPQHTFQILTKRPSQALKWVDLAVFVSASMQERQLPNAPARWPLPNVWLGVSVEDQKTADERIPLLLNTPAAVRWVSYEPALGPVIFQEHDQPEINVNWLRGFDGSEPPVPRLDWVVVGGESGPGARPFYIQWARDVIAQCKAASVPCFMKQLGSNAMGYEIKDRKGGDPSEWPEDLRVREYPQC